MSNSLVQTRSPSIAPALSMLCCGLGQVYCGRTARGLWMYAVSLLFGPAILLIMQGSSAICLTLFIAAVVAVIVVYVASIVDAQRLAAQMARHSAEQRGNRPVLLWGMALVGVPCTLGFGFSLRSDVVEAFYLPTSSMEPTLMKGDRFLANKWNIESRKLERGDVVVFRVPTQPEQLWIKRIVAVSGDTIEMHQGEVFVNGKPLQREPAETSTESGAVQNPRAYFEHNGERRYQVLVGASDDNADVSMVTIPKDSYFVLGDHRGLSRDSRGFGVVSHQAMVGVATWLYGPAGSWERFGSVR